MSGHHALPERSRPTSSLEEPRSDPAERSATARTRAPLEVAGSAGGGSGTLLSSPAPLTWARVRHLFRNARRRVNLARARCLGVGAFALLLVGSAATLVPYARVRTCGRQPTPSPAQPPGHPMGHPQSPGQPPAHPAPPVHVRTECPAAAPPPCAERDSSCCLQRGHDISGTVAQLNKLFVAPTLDWRTAGVYVHALDGDTGEQQELPGSPWYAATHNTLQRSMHTQHTHTPSHAPPPRLPSAHQRVQASQPAVQLAEPPDGGVWHRCDLVPSGRWRAYTAVVPNRRRHRPRGRLLQPAALSAHGAHERTVAHAAPAERPLRDAL